MDDSVFDSGKLTGIQVKLGKQKDGLYLCCLDIDVNKNRTELPFMILDQFKPVLGDNFYSEMSVSKEVLSVAHEKNRIITDRV